MKRNYLGAAIAVVLAAGIALAGCKKNEPAADTTATTPPPAAAEPAATPPMQDTTPATAFATKDTIHASVATDGAGGNLTARWTFQDGQVVDTQDKTIPAGAQVTDFSISKPDGWPAGHYKLEVMNNGMVVQTREFDIK